MSAPARRRLPTSEDLQAVPEHLVAEILDGELFALPRPSPRHAQAASGVGGAVFERFNDSGGGGDSPGGWWILDEPELHLRDDIVVPDVAGWRRERLQTLPETAFIELAPDWVCEVLSPTTEAIDRGRKTRLYARENVSHLWFLNPVLRTLEVYRLVEPSAQRVGGGAPTQQEESRWTLLATFIGDERVHAEPFESLGLDMSRWWVPETKPETG